jgi:hypothetical protein
MSYKGVSKSFWIGRPERELQMVQLSATRWSCIAILWVIIVSFAAITLCVACQRVFIVVRVYFAIESVRSLLHCLFKCFEKAGVGLLSVVTVLWDGRQGFYARQEQGLFLVIGSNAEVKNTWSYTSTSPYVSMVWRLIRYRIRLHGMVVN